eukprot:scaffold68136_cov55-Phaeocystis_antarctica.AAC.4
MQSDFLGGDDPHSNRFFVCSTSTSYSEHFGRFDECFATDAQGADLWGHFGLSSRLAATLRSTATRLVR